MFPETLTAHGWLPTYHVRGRELWKWTHLAERPFLLAVCRDQCEAIDWYEWVNERRNYKS